MASAEAGGMAVVAAVVGDGDGRGDRQDSVIVGADELIAHATQVRSVNIHSFNQLKQARRRVSNSST